MHKHYKNDKLVFSFEDVGNAVNLYINGDNKHSIRENLRDIYDDYCKSKGQDFNHDEYGYAIHEAVDMLEINISCPNVSHGGIAFGTNVDSVRDITSQIKAHSKKPVIMKLSPNVTDITEIAKAAEDAGADALSLINTITGMKIDINKRCFAIANKTGGMSGPAIKPVALRMVYQVTNAVKVPVIGMGGIATADDAIEFLLAGATMVSVGTANFFNPNAGIDVAKGIEKYLEKNGFSDVNEIIGLVK